METSDLNFIAQPTMPKLLELLTLWQGWPKLGQSGAAGLPSREQFEPADVPHILPDICLAEIDRHGNPYRDYDLLYRYIGSRVGENFQMLHLTRQHLSDFGQPFADRWFPVYDRLITSRLPVAVQGVPFQIDKTYLRFEMVLLPLAGSKISDHDARGANTVAYALFATHFGPNPSAVINDGEPIG